MAKVIGFKKYDFVDEKSGKRISGTTMYFTTPIEESKGFGEEPGKCSVSDEILNRVSVIPGDEVRIYFKQNSNKVEDIVLV